ncbi:MAG: Mur ligase family protein, partial [Bacteroidota bacterium]
MTVNLQQLYERFLAHPRVITDSRKVVSDSIFFALKGANFDGNTFALQALEQGAVFAVVDDQELLKHADERLLWVEDVLKSLQQLGRHHRDQFDIPVIGITGSNGKTTTKELISAVLSTQYKTHFTQGNYNNHIGVPLTLLGMPTDTEVAVIEMGANHVGEIDFLCNIAHPTHGIITNIGKAHLEGFGGIEGVKVAKSELYRYLEAYRGIAFVNRDEQYLEALAGHKLRSIYYLKSENPDREVADYEVKFISCDPYVQLAFLSWREEMIEAQSNLIGIYNFN